MLYSGAAPSCIKSRFTRAIQAGITLPLAILFFSASPLSSQEKSTTRAPAGTVQRSSHAEPTKQQPGGGGRRERGDGNAKSGDAKPEKTVYDFYLPGADGKDISLVNYKDKYLLIVNLARKSTYSDQLPALLKLYDTYKGKGLVVIGVPCNDFGAAEPGTNIEIQKAYADAKVNFPITGVSKLTGDDELPFYLFLTKGKTAPPGGPVVWNDTKFVIDKKGNIIARFAPDVAPDSLEMRSIMDQIMDGTYKPKKEGGGKQGDGSVGDGPT